MLVPDTASVKLELQGVGGTNLDGCTGSVTWYVRDEVSAPPWTGAQLALLAQYLRDWWATGKNAGAALRTAVSTDWETIRVVARDLSVALGGSASDTFTQAGLRAGSPAPPSVTALVQFRYDPGAQPQTGHGHYPAGVETDFVGEVWNGAFRAELGQIVLDFVADIGDSLSGGFATWAVVGVSRNSGTHVWGSDPADPPLPRLPTPRAAAITNTFDTATVREVQGSQRERRSTD